MACLGSAILQCPSFHPYGSAEGLAPASAAPGEWLPAPLLPFRGFADVTWVAGLISSIGWCLHGLCITLQADSGAAVLAGESFHCPSGALLMHPRQSFPLSLPSHFPARLSPLGKVHTSWSSVCCLLQDGEEQQIFGDGCACLKLFLNWVGARERCKFNALQTEGLVYPQDTDSMGISRAPPQKRIGLKALLQRRSGAKPW